VKPIRGGGEKMPSSGSPFLTVNSAKQESPHSSQGNTTPAGNGRPSVGGKVIPNPFKQQN